MEARAKACVSVGFGVLKLEFGAPVCAVLGVWIAESFAASGEKGGVATAIDAAFGFVSTRGVELDEPGSS
jgi:hypothetical protein